MPASPTKGPSAKLVRLAASLAALAAAGLLLMAGQWLERVWHFPAPGADKGGLLAQRYEGARLAGEPGPAYLERRTGMSDAVDADFRAKDFSLRLTGFLQVIVPGPYVLAVESDDDSRLFVDGVKVIDNSGRHPMRLYQRTLWLGPGRHLYEVEYAQRDGGAGLRLLWAPPWGGLRAVSPGSLVPTAQPLSRDLAEALAYRVQVAGVPMTAFLLWALAVVLARVWLPDYDQWRHLVLASFLLVLAMWANSGTLAPYAATSEKLRVLEAPGQCHYLANIDHQHYEAVFWMLDGDPVRKWSFSVVLRRVLLPLFSYPFMKTWGLPEGGFLANTAAHLMMLASWAVFLRRRLGARGALWGLYGLALYPGAYYWSGLPYSYAFIVPGSIWGFMALICLGEARGLKGVAVFSGALGILFLGYDLWPFFLPAALMLVWWRTRKPWLAASALPGLILPVAVMIFILSLLGAYSAPLEKGHEPLAVFRSFLGEIDSAAWWELVREAPVLLARTFFYSNYVFLPALFLLFLIAGGRAWGVRLEAAEGCLLLALLGVFLFNNLAPPYPGWQFRGELSLRFYQPALPALLYFTARAVQAAPRGSWAAWPALACLLFSAYVTFGGVAGLPASDYLHWRFGRAGQEGSFKKNMAKYGRRPMGLCPPCREEAGGLPQPRS